MMHIIYYLFTQLRWARIISVMNSNNAAEVYPDTTETEDQ